MSLVNLLAQGVLLGGYYALLACGLSLMFGVMRIINLAHGDLAILAAFLVFDDIRRLRHFAVPGARGGAADHGRGRAGCCSAASWSGACAPACSCRCSPPSASSIAHREPAVRGLRRGHALARRHDRRPVPSTASRSPNQFNISYLAALIFALAVALLGGLSLFLKHTSLGRAIRATAEDPDTAELVGINSRAVYAIAAAIAVATVAIAGTMLAMRATFDPYSGPMQLIFAFEAVVIGGIGSLWGTLLGGIVLGVAQSIGAAIRSEMVPARRTSDVLRGARRSHVPGPGAARAAASALRLWGSGDERRERGLRRALDARVGRLRRRRRRRSSSALASAPLIAGANVVDKLTTLVRLCHSRRDVERAGRLRRARLGRPAGVLRHRGLFRHPSRPPAAFPPIRPCSPARSARRCSRSRFPTSCCDCSGGEFSIGMWVLAEALHLMVNQDPLVQGETGTSMIALNAYPDPERLAANYWLALGGDAGAARRDLRPVAQPVRRLGAGDPRRRGGGGLDRRQGPRRQADDIHPGGFRLRARRRRCGSRLRSPSSRRPISECSGPPT